MRGTMQWSWLLARVVSLSTGCQPAESLSASETGGPQASRVEALVSNSWTANTPMSTPRGRSAAILLDSGEVVVTGGLASYMPTTVTEIYNPGSGTWRQVSPSPEFRMGHTAPRLYSGYVLVTGVNREGGRRVHPRSTAAPSPSRLRASEGPS